MDNHIHKYGFKYGFMDVRRACDNNGKDKKTKFSCVRIHHDNGDYVDIEATKNRLYVFGPVKAKEEDD